MQTKNIFVKNGTIEGETTYINNNLSLENLRLSSISLGHTARMQALAPKNINFSNINFLSHGVDALYLTQGSTYVTVQNSVFKGTISGVAIYLDAESGFNTIRYNNFKAMTSSKREIIAVDGSANNSITNNQLKRTDISGGIFLYRNCGEAGVVRHQAAVYNTINYNTIDTDYCLDPSDKVYGTPIFLNSRMGNRNYCSLDSGYSFGSSINDFDFGKSNQIAYNKIQSCTTKPPLMPSYHMLIRDGYRDYSSSQLVQSFFSSGFGNDIHSNTATQAPLVFPY